MPTTRGPSAPTAAVVAAAVRASTAESAPASLFNLFIDLPTVVMGKRHLGWDQDTLICSPICACCLTQGSGPDEKVASDFTSVPDPSARRFHRERDQGDRFMIARAERLTRPVPLIPTIHYLLGGDSLLIGLRFVTKWVAICGYLVAVYEKYLAQISKTNDIWHKSCYICLVIRWL